MLAHNPVFSSRTAFHLLAAAFILLAACQAAAPQFVAEPPTPTPAPATLTPSSPPGGPIATANALITALPPRLTSTPINEAAIRQWLQENAHPLQSSEFIEDDSDLAFLQEVIGDRRVVMLGEATHGTHEFFTIKKPASSATSSSIWASSTSSSNPVGARPAWWTRCCRAARAICAAPWPSTASGP